MTRGLHSISPKELIRDFLGSRRTAGARGPLQPPVPMAALHSLLVAGVAVYLPLASELPLWVSAVFLIGAGWRLAAAHRLIVRPGRWLLLCAAAVVIGVTYRHYGGLLGRDPGVALLVALTGLKLLELRNRRDYVLTAFLLYVVLLGAFLYGQSLALGLYGAAAAAITTAALLQLGRDTPLSARVAVRITATLLLQALPIMLLLYFLFPRFSGALWGVPLRDGSGTTGMSEVMRPGSVQRLVESAEPAFRASMADAPPPLAALYWRGLVLWDTDGTTWRAGTPILHADAGGFVPRSAPVRYQIILEPHGKQWLYALDAPVEPPPGARLAAGRVLQRPRPLLERLSYELVSYPRYQTGALAPTERARALALPRAVSERVRALALDWRSAGPPGTAADAEVVTAALQYFRREPFHYTLTPPALGNDPVDAFLFEARRGFCEHYASAFVTLMRAAGIPSRVIAGYQGGVYNPAGNYFLVRQADAHAWAEVWLPGEGWRRVDPTAAVAPERVEHGIDAVRRLQAQGVNANTLSTEMLQRLVALGWLDRAWLRTHLAWDYANLSWYRWVGNYDHDRRAALLARLNLSQHALLAMVLGVLALIVLYALYHARRHEPSDPAAAVYARFCRKCAAIGLARLAHEGPLAFAERCISARPDLAAAIATVTRHYVALRYGSAPPQNLAALNAAVRGFNPSRAV